MDLTELESAASGWSEHARRPPERAARGRPARDPDRRRRLTRGRPLYLRAMTDVAIVVHGGAGRWPEDAHDRALDGVRRAVEAGHAVLAGGGDALAAVQAAVIVLEDDAVFNAGRGAALDERGLVSLDASIMRGADRAAGSVANLRGIRNPILAARAVLDEGPPRDARRQAGRRLRPRRRARDRARGVVPDRTSASSPSRPATTRAAGRSAPSRATRRGGSPRRRRPAAAPASTPGVSATRR